MISSKWARADVLAGLTTAAVVAPKAMAYATIAGLPVHIGLYTAIVPMAVYAALGTSRPLSVSTTTTPSTAVNAIEEAISSGRAPITGATAAIAELPQIELPHAISTDIFFGRPSARPIA